MTKKWLIKCKLMRKYQNLQAPQVLLLSYLSDLTMYFLLILLFFNHRGLLSSSDTASSFSSQGFGFAPVDLKRASFSPSQNTRLSVQVPFLARTSLTNIRNMPPPFLPSHSPSQYLVFFSSEHILSDYPSFSICCFNACLPPCTAVSIWSRPWSRPWWF